MGVTASSGAVGFVWGWRRVVHGVRGEGEIWCFAASPSEGGPPRWAAAGRRRFGVPAPAELCEPAERSAPSALLPLLR